MNYQMTRTARIHLHACCLRRTFSLRRSGWLNTLRWHGYGIARALFCDWKLNDNVRWYALEVARLVLVLLSAVAVTFALWVAQEAIR